MAVESSAPVPRLVLQDEAPLLSLLRKGQDLLWRNPQAARSLIQALVAEGRRFASTPEGAQWQARLAGTDLVQRGRLIWQAYGLDNLLNAEPDLLPSGWLNLFLEALEEADLEQILLSLMTEEAQRGNFSTP